MTCHYYTQMWIVLLIGQSKFSTNQKHYPHQGIVTRHQYEISPRFLDVILRGFQR